MDTTFEFAARPGNLGLSILSLGGVALLAAMLWHVAPGIVLLIFVPALLICGYQMIVTPVFGLRISRSEWVILDGDQDFSVPADQIAYLRIVSRGDAARATLVLVDGEEWVVPIDLSAEPLDLIHAATEHGVPVRSQ